MLTWLEYITLQGSGDVISPTCAINSCVSRRNVSSLIVVYLGMFLSFGNPGNRKLLQLNSCCFPL